MDPATLGLMTYGIIFSGITMTGIWIPQLNNWRVRLSRWYNTQVKSSYTHTISRTGCPSLFYMISLIMHNTIKSKSNSNFVKFKKVTTMELSYKGETTTLTVVKPTHQIQIQIGCPQGKKYLYIYVVGDHNNENPASYELWTPYGDKEIACEYMIMMLFSFDYNLVKSFETFEICENARITSLIQNLRRIIKNKSDATLATRSDELTSFLSEKSIVLANITEDNIEEYLLRPCINLNADIQRDLIVYRYAQFVKYKLKHKNVNISDTERNNIINHNDIKYQTFSLLLNNTQSPVVKDILSSFNIKHYVRLKAEERKKWYELKCKITLWPVIFSSLIENNQCSDIDTGLNTMYINFLEKKNTLLLQGSPTQLQLTGVVSTTFGDDSCNLSSLL